MDEATTADGRRSVMDVFLSKMRKEFAPQENKPSKEKQIRLKKDTYGEVLTSKEVVKRLKDEEERRNNKRPKKVNTKKAGKK